MNKTALIAMSGGVDSSVAAYFMKKAGYDCTGVTMKLFQNEEVGVSREHTCCSLDDVEDARSVAFHLDIPFYVFNFSDRFEECVIRRFVEAYEKGMTPNPCIDCNRFLKFDKLYQRAQELNLDYIVTGHYARIEKDDTSGRYLLKKAVDADKDQSYVLYTLTQEQLSHTQFPLGSMTKQEVRKIAEAQGFVNARKHDSQDICFVVDGKYGDFIENYTGKAFPEGDFVDQEGKVLGKHKGIIRYTIGQRKGLGLAVPEPVYVCSLDLEKNQVVLGKNEDLFSSVLTASDINLISVPEITEPMRVKAKVRYRQKEQWATVTQTGTDELRVVFDEPQRAITCGQAVVLYDGDVVVGGGTIDGVG
ncbi:MAG: tRNA 2-thiouridine(34) synthase MnmA [Lachnospiraceae bacterium]|nr:tRNA 2-thiouridine(34) synthase MnmA [Lachnospiraceae bacterium]